MDSCVIVLNWNGWKDTVECLESVFRLNGTNFRVVVCDNASSDGSLSHIKRWAAGEVQAGCDNTELSRLSLPPYPKPIECVELTRAQAESGAASYDVPLVLIQAGGNLGFAGGNNVGARYALFDSSCEFFWFLNNDTVVEPDALLAMIRLMEQEPAIGLSGSLNLSYYNPAHVQAEGGKSYCRWTARVQPPPLRTVDELRSDPVRMDFVQGTSMLCSRVFLEQVGLMEESYFLYFEELDWAMRMKGQFKLGYARESVVYHKEGASIGTNANRRKRSVLADQYASRNRVLFTKRFLPWALPSVLVSVILSSAHRLLSGDFRRAWGMFLFMLRGLSEGVPKSKRRTERRKLGAEKPAPAAEDK
jgi:GT2 family glycosyltransferase